MQISIFVTQFLVILQKECHFHFKNDILKHADSALEWRESRFRGLEISKP